MSVKIENVTNRPVLLRLNSGKTLHLAPNTTSTEILEVDVNNNSKVHKLQDRKVIALHKVVKRPTVDRKKGKSESTKQKITV